MSFIVACIDHRLARLESAARTFLRGSDLHRREARAAVERDVFDGADALTDAEAEMEVHEGSGLLWCAGLDAPTNVPADLAASGTNPGEVSATTPDLAPSPGQLLRDRDRDVLPIIAAALNQHGVSNRYPDRTAFRLAGIVLDATATALDALK